MASRLSLGPSESGYDVPVEGCVEVDAAGAGYSNGPGPGQHVAVITSISILIGGSECRT